MSETERRRKYRRNGVLIETARVLTSTFHDAVVFLSGAQLELMRNVMQYLNRRDTYVSEYNPGYYLTPTDEDYDDILAVVADLEETLMGNPNTIWGYADRWFFADGTASTGAGITEIESTPVPAGYVYVLQHWTVWHQGEQTCSVQVRMYDGANAMKLFEAPAVPDDEPTYGTPHIVLKEDDVIQLWVLNLPDTKPCYMRLWGYTMKVPEE